MSVLKAIGPPGSLGFLVVSIAVGLVVAYGWPRKPRLGWVWVCTVGLTYGVLSWPPAAQAIVDGLGAPPPTVITKALPLDALLIFDGDNRRGRVSAAAHVMAAAAPEEVHVLGSPWILAEMTDVMRSQVTHHPGPANTREQVAWMQRFLATTGRRRTAVLVSRLQAPRVSALMAGSIPVAIIASPLDSELRAPGLERLIPTYAALCASRDAIYEHVALFYYRSRGWI